MKQKLKELLEDTLKEWECDVSTETIEEIAEHLIQNGVIVLPSKVGDTLYFGNYKGEVVENEILDIRYRTKTKSGFYNDISIHKVGKTVYVTRKEGQADAERKLREVGET